MRLADWLAAKPERTIQQLARDAVVAYPTAHKAAHGEPVQYGTAKKLSAATNGEVTIDELCEPSPARRVKKTG